MKLSVIMPVFNGERFILENTRKVESLMSEYVSKGIIDDYEIIVVDDGSIDNTLVILKDNFLTSDKVKIIENKFNQGKGFALKNGFFNSSGDVVVMIDSDLDIPPEQVENLINEFKNGYDIVITSKFEKGSQLKYPFFRKIVSFGFYMMIKFLFGLPFKDTQTGLKLFRREVLEVCLSRMVVKRFAFDLELLLIAYRYNFTIKPVPVKINYHSSGFISPRVLIMSFIDTLAIFYRLRILQFYDRPVFISKENVYNFYFAGDDGILEGINCDSKKFNNILDNEYVILKKYEINKVLDIGILTSLIRSYRVEIINGSSSTKVSGFSDYLKSSILFSHFLQPLFNLSSRVVTPKIIPIPVSGFLCVSGKVFRYLVSEGVDLKNDKEVILAISKKYHSVLFVSDWNCIQDIRQKELFSEFFSNIGILVKTGNVGGLFGLGVLFFSLWMGLTFGVVSGSYIFTLPFTLFYLSYLSLKCLVSGVKYISVFPVFLFFSFLVGLIGIASPILSLFEKE